MFMFIRQALIVGRPFAYIAYENRQTANLLLLCLDLM